MAERFKFTTSRLEKLTCPAGKDRVYFHDEQTLGLQVVVTPKSKTFVLLRKIAGRTARVRLGLWPHELSIESARKEATKANGLIAAGLDPRASKRAARAEMTFGELFAIHLEDAKRHNKPKSWESDESQFKLYLSPWKNRRLSEITRADVQRMHNKIGERGPYSANRALALIAHMFRRTAADNGWTGGNPAAGVQRFKEKSRERFLHADELPRLFAALRDSPIQDFVVILLMTGARKSNTMSMRWSDVHLDRGLWFIDETKNGQSLTVPLSAKAVEVLARRKEEAGDDEYVFPARTGGGHMVAPDKEWRRVREAAKLPDLRIHDLRRTTASWMIAGGVPMAVVGKSLGHRSTATTAVYARLSLSPVKNAIDLASTAMLAAGESDE